MRTGLYDVDIARIAPHTTQYLPSYRLFFAFNLRLLFPFFSLFHKRSADTLAVFITQIEESM